MFRLLFDGEGVAVPGHTLALALQDSLTEARLCSVPTPHVMTVPRLVPHWGAVSKSRFLYVATVVPVCRGEKKPGLKTNEGLGLRCGSRFDLVAAVCGCRSNAPLEQRFVSSWENRCPVLGDTLGPLHSRRNVRNRQSRLTRRNRICEAVDGKRDFHRLRVHGQVAPGGNRPQSGRRADHDVSMLLAFSRVAVTIHWELGAGPPRCGSADGQRAVSHRTDES